MDSSQRNTPADEQEELQPLEVEGDPEDERQPQLTSLAWLLSYLMHPLPLPSILFGLILLFAPEMILASSVELRYQLWGLLFLTTFAIPALSVLTLRVFGNIPSLTMTRREDRRLPFMFVSVFYVITTGFFWVKFPQLTLVGLALTGITLCLLLLTVISFWWKMSAHGISAGGACGFLTGLLLELGHPELLYALALLIILSGAVMWARLYLNHHQPEEVWAGYGLGFLLCLLVVLLLYPALA